MQNNMFYRLGLFDTPTDEAFNAMRVKCGLKPIETKNLEKPGTMDRPGKEKAVRSQAMAGVLEEKR